MESIAYFFFTLRLLFSITNELVSVLLRLFIGTKTFLLSFFLFGLLSASQVAQIVFKAPPAPPEIIFEKDRQAAETRISFWESLVAVSPNRDAFLNLEKLYRYLDEEDRAKLFRKRAFALDPNNPEFKNDTWLWEEEIVASPSATPVVIE